MGAQSQQQKACMCDWWSGSTARHQELWQCSQACLWALSSAGHVRLPDTIGATAAVRLLVLNLDRGWGYATCLKIRCTWMTGPQPNCTSFCSYMGSVWLSYVTLPGATQTRSHRGHDLHRSYSSHKHCSSQLTKPPGHDLALPAGLI